MKRWMAVCWVAAVAGCVGTVREGGTGLLTCATLAQDGDGEEIDERGICTGIPQSVLDFLGLEMPDEIAVVEIGVDKEKIVVKDVAEFAGFLELMEYWAKVNRPLANSFVVQREEGYLGRFYRVRYTAFPDFRDEVSGAGADAIKAYYVERYRAALTNEVVNSLYGYDAIIDSCLEEFHYTVQVYSVEYANPYLSVNFYTDWDGGGAHANEGKYADVFDMDTGKKLELGDIVNVSSHGDVINALVAEHLRANDIDPFREGFDIRETLPSSFRMTKEGVVLIFQPYEIAAYIYGIIEVPLYRMGGR